MNTASLFALGVAVVALVSSAVSTVQTPTPQSSAPLSVAMIHPIGFEDKQMGIHKIVAASSALNGQFKPQFDELQSLNTKLAALDQEVKELRARGAAEPEQRAKIDEFESLKKVTQQKSEDFRAEYEKRRQIVMEPILREVGDALIKFAKSKGIRIVLDEGAVAGLVLYVDESADITKEFIAYFNGKST